MKSVAITHLEPDTGEVHINILGPLPMRAVDVGGQFKHRVEDKFDELRERGVIFVEYVQIIPARENRLLFFLVLVAVLVEQLQQIGLDQGVLVVRADQYWRRP